MEIDLTEEAIDKLQEVTMVEETWSDALLRLIGVYKEWVRNNE